MTPRKLPYLKPREINWPGRLTLSATQKHLQKLETESTKQFRQDQKPPWSRILLHQCLNVKTVAVKLCKTHKRLGAGCTLFCTKYCVHCSVIVGLYLHCYLYFSFTNSKISAMQTKVDSVMDKLTVIILRFYVWEIKFPFNKIRYFFTFSTFG